eukprot:TRINITY_DN5651_c0_g1_i1.p1 TRINITY_DN5651_c0_g1~~TRINITY_DN5651_c0_g1_i1.p1  ORF type:complete len:584 (-),score=110.26 TRINITY_DN5651_c0_g1_i1:63-1814(-)
MRWCRLCCVLFAAAVAVAHCYTSQTHRDVARLALRLALNDQQQLSDEMGMYENEIVLGAREEDCATIGTIDCPYSFDLSGGALCGNNRYLNHFYNPWTGTGFTSERLLGTSELSCMSALQWARNDDFKSTLSSNTEPGTGLTWTGALKSYGYTFQEKRAAYRRLGHVEHIITDLAQPEHTHLEPHAGHQGFENWVQDNWNTSLQDSFTLNSLRVVPVSDDLEQHLRTIAFESYNLSSFYGGKLQESERDSFRQDNTELQLAFRVTYDNGIFGFGDDWELRNYRSVSSMSSAIAYLTVHDYEREYMPVDIGRDDFWELRAEGSGAPEGFFYVEEIVQAVPRRFKTNDNTGNRRSLAYLFASSLLPPAIQYSAGLYEFYWAIVNPPPFVRTVRLMQDSGYCVLDETWDDVLDTRDVSPRGTRDDHDESGIFVLNTVARRELNRRCASPLDPSKGNLTVTIVFDGSSVSEVTINVTLVGVPLDTRHGISTSWNDNARTWTASVPAFLLSSLPPPSTLSMSRCTRMLGISARDDDMHYMRRVPVGDELDSDPSTPATLAPDLKAPYEWNPSTYTPGVDERRLSCPGR